MLETKNCKSSDLRIQHVLELIHGEADRQFAVEELARTVGLSPSYFQHLFRRETQVSPAKYLQDLKLCRAAHLLKTTSLPIKSILQVVGLNDASHFIRNFRRKYETSPSTYRLQARRCIAASATPAFADPESVASPALADCDAP